MVVPNDRILISQSRREGVSDFHRLVTLLLTSKQIAVRGGGETIGDEYLDRDKRPGLEWDGRCSTGTILGRQVLDWYNPSLCTQRNALRLVSRLGSRWHLFPFPASKSHVVDPQRAVECSERHRPHSHLKSHTNEPLNERFCRRRNSTRSLGSAERRRLLVAAASPIHMKTF